MSSQNDGSHRKDQNSQNSAYISRVEGSIKQSSNKQTALDRAYQIMKKDKSPVRDTINSVRHKRGLAVYFIIIFRVIDLFQSDRRKMTVISNLSFSETKKRRRCSLKYQSQKRLLVTLIQTETVIYSQIGIITTCNDQLAI